MMMMSYHASPSTTAATKNSTTTTDNKTISDEQLRLHMSSLMSTNETPNSEHSDVNSLEHQKKCSTKTISNMKMECGLKDMEDEDVLDEDLDDLDDDEEEIIIVHRQTSTSKVSYDGDEEDVGEDEDHIDQTDSCPEHGFYRLVVPLRAMVRNDKKSLPNSSIKNPNLKLHNRNIEDEDKDSLVGTSATGSDDEYDLDSNAQGSKISSCGSSGFVSCSSAIDSNKMKANKDARTTKIDSNNNSSHKFSMKQLETPLSVPAQTTPASNCNCSDMIELDHYTTDSMDGSSTNGSNDNLMLTFSPLPPFTLNEKILTLGGTITSNEQSPVLSISSMSLQPKADISHVSESEHKPSPISSEHLPSYQHRPSTSMASIRDAVSHLTRLDDFNVVKLSQGFFSQVFKVTHLPTGKIMVLKMNKNPGNRGNALKEIELLNKLNHPNIVAYMGTVVHEGALHPLLEYINGGTLEQLIHKYYPSSLANNKNQESTNHVNSQTNSTNGNHNIVYPKVSSPKVHRLKNVDRTFMSLMQDVCRGMAYLHSKGYLHRDLASKNIFIRKRMPNEPIIKYRKHINKVLQTKVPQSECNFTIPVPEEKSSFFDNNLDKNPEAELRDESSDEDFFDDNRLEAVIGDFGFATTEPSPQHKLSIVGSPYWLGPECLKNKWYNHKCDIFSFGVICCELNWRTPSDPDFLPRSDNYGIDFQKLHGKKDTLLGRVAMLACQYEPENRPEFHELLTIFNEELLNFVDYEPVDSIEYNNNKSKKFIQKSDRFWFSYSPLPPQMMPHHADEQNHYYLQEHTFPRASFKRFNSFDGTNLRPDANQDSDDAFEQHLRRRRHSALYNCNNLATLELMAMMDMDLHNGRL